jgi:hypothetical protein
MILRAALVVAGTIAVAPITPAIPTNAQTDCPPGTYQAASGDCVPYPKKGSAPCPNPTAICADGSYSCSEHPHSGGTCHGHGGVAQYL